jgi:GT2 family glycosyltransferase
MNAGQAIASTPPTATFCLAMVLGYGRFAHTTRLCLDSLLPQALALPAALRTQVLAVDNGSPDDSANLLRHYAATAPALQTAYNTQNLGFGGGMNQAAQSATADTEWLLLVNSDLIFQPNSLMALLQALHGAPAHVGLLGPVTNEAGNAQKLSPPALHGASPAALAAASSQALLSAPLRTLWPSLRADFFCVAIRKSLWDTLEGLDRIYGRGYYEDFDFSLRAKALGYDCAICENSFIYHEGSASFKADPAQKKLIKGNKAIFQARFIGQEIPHVRLENLRQIERYLTKLEALKTTQQTHASEWQGLALRLNWRLRMARADQPRSFWKRWLWQRRLRALDAPLVALGFADLAH